MDNEKKSRFRDRNKEHKYGALIRSSDSSKLKSEHVYTSSKRKRYDRDSSPAHSSVSKYGKGGSRLSSEKKISERESRYGSSEIRNLDKDQDISDCQTNDFSFESYRHILNQVFFKSGILDDQEDFWKFVRKYESVQKQSGDKLKNITADAPSSSTQFGLPSYYNKSHFVSIALATSIDKLFLQLPPQDWDTGRKLSQKRFLQFCDIVVIYLDFKQKEKFSKLCKLRQSQKNLPVTQFREQIVTSVYNERVVIIAGDTGCGKSTQVPQYLLNAGYKRIACTQPRRIACTSLSKRVAFETLNEYGLNVGYQIRFERNKAQHTKILFITEGLLLRQISMDPSLSTYDVIVLDEVHERHLHGDFLLGVVKCLLYQREDLKVVLMSATINIQLFQDYFSDAATIIQVPGRLYTIKLHFRPLGAEERSSKGERINPAPYMRILQLIDEKYPQEEKGDVLMFLSGMSEISTVVEAAQAYSQQSGRWIVLPLHSTLSLADQEKVFDYPPDGVRKCIVSTNIAETSITIDGIRFVVDSGKVKEMSYDPTCKMQKLKEFWISRASAEQRKGRAGRTGPGVCYRLYSEDEYSSMEEYSTPEIQRVPLDSLLLQMVAMGLPDARKFPFIEPPPSESIENSILSLKQQGALSESEKLTTVGRMLSVLPVDIALGKMLIMGSLFHQVEPVLSLAAALSVQTPFTNRAYRDPECERARKDLESDHGDPIILLNALREWLEVKRNSTGGRAQSRQWCKRRGLEEQRFYEMTKLRRQFKDLLKDSGLLMSDAEPQGQQTSSERALRHGELKLLRTMQRSYRETGPRKRRQLKLDVWQLGEEEGAEPGDIDIKDVEFRLTNDSSQVQHLVSGATACSYKDLSMLKLILVSGLYPQLAVADEFNYCKSVAEQLFHTQGKPYVSLHPMGFFGNHPQVLQLEESDIVVSQGSGIPSKLPLSSKHQLLCYLSLLETTKPYLVTSLRMPAAQTLLLFSQMIDTNADFTKMVCDSWLQLEFPLAEAAAKLLLQVAELRNKWELLLKLKLEATQPSIQQEEKSARAVRSLERYLSMELPLFMHREVCYSIKRLLAADRKVMYVGPCGHVSPVDPNPFTSAVEWQCEPHPTKGGMRVTPYITYNCIIEKDESLYQSYGNEPWTCPHCDMNIPLSAMEQLQHLQACQPSQDQQDVKEIEEMEKMKPNSQTYYCNDCKKTLHLTATEILRHKKQHSNADLKTSL